VRIRSTRGSSKKEGKKFFCFSALDTGLKKGLGSFAATAV